MSQKTRKKQKRPFKSFYEFINRDWLQKTTIPDTESRITQTYCIQSDIDKEIDQIIRVESSKKNPMSELIESWRTTEGRIPIGITSLTQIMLTMTNPTDIASRIGWMNRYGITPPLAIYVQGDPRNHKRCCVFIEEGEPGIGSPDYWTESEFVQHRAAYSRYVSELSRVLDIPLMKRGYDAEHEFASVFPNIVERTTRVHMLTWKELNRTYKHIDWTVLLTSLGLQESVLPDLVFNVTSAAFLHHLQNRIVRWPIERWQGWFALIAAQWIASCSPRGPLRTAWFAYKCTFLQGAIVDNSSKEICNNFIRAMMPNTLGKLWVKQFCDPKLPKTILNMVNTIRTAAVSVLRQSSWMSADTQSVAIRKLRAMDIQIGWPEFKTWVPSENACTLNNRSLIDNLLSLRKLATDENHEMLHSGNCRHPTGKNWGKSVFDVNAYYYPDENRFVLPASILRPPFYDPRKPDTWNYGSIGATIGHELCHAFDSDGRQFDERGDKRDWWSDRDDEQYRRKAKQIERLFDSAKYHGLTVDGKLTQIENIADLGGIVFALAGLRHVSKTQLTKTDLQQFFTAFAVSWQSKERKRRQQQLLTTDVHAPPQLRVDLVVQQLDEWYVAFDIGPDSPMWISPEKRIRFFG